VVNSFDSTAVTLLVAGGCVAVLFAVVVAVRYAATFPALPKAEPPTSDLRDEPPAVANLLVNRCHPTEAAAAATVVDLAARGHLELFEAGPGRLVVRLRSAAHDDLTDYESQVLALVEERAVGGSAPLEALQLSADQSKGWHRRFAKRIVEDARRRGLLRGRWSRHDLAVLAVLAAAALALVAGGLYAAHVEDLSSSGSSSSHSFHRGDWFWVALGAWFAILAGLRALRSVRYSPAGLTASSHWLGVRRYLRQDPSFADLTPAAVAIWDRMLAYGVAVGAAHATATAIPLAAESAHTAWSREGGTWHQLHVEYPRHFGYGERPRAVALGGLGRTVLWGALAFVALPVLADGAWNLGRDVINGSKIGSGGVAALVGVFFVVFALLAVVLLVRLADGVIRLGRGLADLGTPITIDGLVVKSTGDGSWFAIDPGHVDHVAALRAVDTARPNLGATIRVTVTPHLHHVQRIETVPSPLTPAP
jgi:hypothetical protein